MAKLLKLRRGTTSQHSSFTGAEGEVTIDTTKDTAVVHDGSQAGGRPLLREDVSNLGAVITNSHIASNAAISASKISGLSTDKINEGNTNIEVTDTQSNNTYGVISAALGFTDGSGNSTTDAGYLHSTKTGNDILTEINKNHTGNDNIFKLGVGTTGGTGGFAVQKGDTDQNIGELRYTAASGGGQWRLSTGSQLNYLTTQTANIFDKNVIPNTDSATDLGLTGTRWRNVYADDYYGSAANLTNIPAANITGTLPAIDGSNLTGIAGIPSGVIAIWSGAVSAIPSGWVLCDGNNSTPDLRSKFIVGANDSTGDTAYPGLSVGATGGASVASAQVSVNGNTGWASQYANASSMPNASPEPFNSRDRHQHGWGGTFTSSSFNILPPYYALAFIMKS